MFKINAEKNIIGIWKKYWCIENEFDQVLFDAHGVVDFGGENPFVMSVIENMDCGKAVSLLFCRKDDDDTAWSEDNVKIIELLPSFIMSLDDSIIHFVAGEMRMASVMASKNSLRITPCRFMIRNTVFSFLDSVFRIQKEGKTEVMVKLNPEDTWAPAKILEGMYRAFESISEHMVNLKRDNTFSVDFQESR